MRIKSVFILLVLLSSLSAQADDAKLSAEEEITLLISSVEVSGCIFHRNGGTHSATDAADHMRLKLFRGRRHAKTTEGFIERLASKSSFSGKPYHIECQPGELVTAEFWLNTELDSIRS